MILLEPVESKREMGLKLGADHAFDPLKQDIPEELQKIGVRRISTVIECVGRVSTLQQAISLAGKDSVVMMFGLTKPDEQSSASSPLRSSKRKLCSMPRSSTPTPSSGPWI